MNEIDAKHPLELDKTETDLNKSVESLAQDKPAEPAKAEETKPG